ncbi:hypothetical protein Tsubulata_037056 [Turnera subulata]|uniref:RING-type E3 ubiquitin transferase n=1 Tax=Turnera subulata TaxID=218843 RepID=A0A9Q0FXQ6_9ROSI|nr:hypothetical protein Tsubulata_037056 [Turnera subulata]
MALSLSSGSNINSSSDIHVFAEPSSPNSNLNNASSPSTNSDEFVIHAFFGHHIQSESPILSDESTDPGGDVLLDSRSKEVKYRRQDLISGDNSSSALSREIISEIMMGIGFPLENMFWGDLSVKGDDHRHVELTGVEDLTVKILEVKDRMDREGNYEPMLLTIERTVVLPDNEYRELLQAKSQVDSIKRSLKMLVDMETLGDIQPRIWDATFEVVRTSVIPWIFWGGIWDNIAESTLGRFRKEFLMFELRNALEEMAEAVTTMESAREEMSRPKPAASSAIEALPKYTVSCSNDDDSRMCVICMEELTIGSQFTMMPCSHEFHGPCIEQWLLESHVCPLCRFELPTAEQDN